MLIDFNTIKIDWTTINWTAISAIGTCLGSFATFCAVIVALWQTKWESRKVIKLDFNYHFLMDITGQMPRQNMVALKVINVCKRNIVIEEWGFKLRGGLSLTAMPNISNLGANLPATIEPDKSIQLLMSSQALVQELNRLSQEQNINENDKLVLYVRDNFSKYYILKSKATLRSLRQMAEV